MPATLTARRAQFRQYVIANFPTSLAAMFFKDFPAPACLSRDSNSYRQRPAHIRRPVRCRPNRSGSSARPLHNGVIAGGAYSQADQYTVRFDERFSPRDQFYARWVATQSSGDVARDELFGAKHPRFHLAGTRIFRRFEPGIHT